MAQDTSGIGTKVGSAVGARRSGTPHAAFASLHPNPRPTSLGDAAVDGLLAGLGAGSVMLALLVVATIVRGAPIVPMLSSLGPDQQGSAWQGIFAHVALSAICGAVWGVLATYGVQRTRLPFWLAGLLYGGLLTLVGLTLFVQNSTWPALPPLLLTASHLLYGLLLGLNYPRAHFSD